MEILSTFFGIAHLWHRGFHSKFGIPWRENTVYLLKYRRRAHFNESSFTPLLKLRKTGDGGRIDNRSMLESCHKIRPPQRTRCWEVWFGQIFRKEGSNIRRLTNLEYDHPDSEALGLMIDSAAAAPADQAILRSLPASVLLRLAIVWACPGWCIQSDVSILSSITQRIRIWGNITVCVMEIRERLCVVQSCMYSSTYSTDLIDSKLLPEAGI